MPQQLSNNSQRARSLGRLLDGIQARVRDHLQEMLLPAGPRSQQAQVGIGVCSERARTACTAGTSAAAAARTGTGTGARAGSRDAGV